RAAAARRSGNTDAALGNGVSAPARCRLGATRDRKQLEGGRAPAPRRERRLPHAAAPPRRRLPRHRRRRRTLRVRDDERAGDAAPPRLAPALTPTFLLGGELEIRRLGFGAMRVEDTPVLRRAVELGVNFIDTADIYSAGRSEELIAEALHPYPEGL